MATVLSAAGHLQRYKPTVAGRAARTERTGHAEPTTANGATTCCSASTSAGRLTPVAGTRTTVGRLRSRSTHT